jgi:hypothetical protein
VQLIRRIRRAIPVGPRFWTAIKLPSTVPNSSKCRQTNSAGNDEHLFRCRISQASNSWFCFVVHSESPDQLCASERRTQILNTAFRLHAE